MNLGRLRAICGYFSLFKGGFRKGYQAFGVVILGMMAIQGQRGSGLGWHNSEKSKEVGFGAWGGRVERWPFREFRVWSVGRPFWRVAIVTFKVFRANGAN